MAVHMRYILLLILLALFPTGGCETDRGKEKIITPSGRIVRIGVIAPMTGPDYPKGQDGLRGIQTILHNRPFLNNGDKIEILVEDDKNQADLSVKAFQKLVEKDKVAAVIVLSPSKFVLGINKIVDQYGTPVLVTIASHPEIALNTRYMNQICIDNNFQGKVAALYARDELLITRAAVFEDSSNEHSVSLAGVFKEQFSKLDGKIGNPLGSSMKKAEVKEQLLSLKKEEVEMLYLPLDAKQFIFISKILTEISWNPVRMGSDGLLSTVMAKHIQDRKLMNNIIGIDFYNTDTSRYLFGRTLVKNYLLLFKQKANTYTVASAEGFTILLNAMNKCKLSGNREQINEQIRKTDKFTGFIGKITIRPNGKAQRALIVNTITEDGLEFLVRVH